MNTILLSKITTKIAKPFCFRKSALYVGAALLIAGGSLPSCSTASGFGRDVEKVGDNIQEAAN